MESTQGTAAAKLSFVQVKFTTFSSDNFELAITAPKPFRGATDNLAAGRDLRRLVADKLKPEHPEREGKRAGKTKTIQLAEGKAPLIGASCLSIIGMIEPGRTVRLYRQIH